MMLQQNGAKYFDYTGLMAKRRIGFKLSSTRCIAMFCIVNIQYIVKNVRMFNRWKMFPVFIYIINFPVTISGTAVLRTSGVILGASSMHHVMVDKLYTTIITRDFFHLPQKQGKILC